MTYSITELLYPKRAKRRKPRRGQPTKTEKEACRRAVYERSGGLCEVRKHPRCIRGVLPWDGDVFTRFHLAHLRSKRVHGWELSNLKGACYWCHIDYLHNAGGKPCPAKPKGAIA